MNHAPTRLDDAASNPAGQSLPPTHAVRFGPVEIANPFILAPMAGVSERPFRVLARGLGASYAPTELVSAAGLIRASGRSKRFLAHAPSERPFGVQLFGGDPEQMGEAAALAKAQGADLLDINMGCPVPKVTKNGAGSALLCLPDRAASVVAAMVRASGLPVTVKIRSGWDARSINAPEMAKALEGAGAAAVALHARTRAQGYSGKADWSLIGRVKAAVQIPVVGNGDVRSASDAARMMAQTGCDAVMIGRAALGYPWIFRELLGGPAPTPEERGALVRQHLCDHLAFLRETTFRTRVENPEQEELHGLRMFRKHLLWYAHGLRGATTFRARAARLEGKAEVLAAIDEFFCEAIAAEPHELAGEPEYDARGALG